MQHSLIAFNEGSLDCSPYRALPPYFDSPHGAARCGGPPRLYEWLKGFEFFRSYYRFVSMHELECSVSLKEKFHTATLHRLFRLTYIEAGLHVHYKRYVHIHKLEISSSSF